MLALRRIANAMLVAAFAQTHVSGSHLHAAPTKPASSTVDMTCRGIRFTMHLPREWKSFERVAERDRSDWRAFVGTFRNTMIRFEHDEVCDSDNARVAARKNLEALPDEEALNAKTEKGWKTTLHDRKIIQIDGVDAALHVVSSGREKEVPWIMNTVCKIRWGEIDLTIHGRYYDTRRERQGKDYEQARAEVLTIIQSLRLIKAVDGAEPINADKSDP